MNPVHGNIAISAPMVGDVWGQDGKKISVAPIFGGGILTKEGGVWDYADFSNPNFVEGDLTGLPDGFHFVYLHTVQRKPQITFSQVSFEKDMAGPLVGPFNVPVEVMIGDATKTLIGFVCPTGGTVFFDALNGRSLTANAFNFANRFMIRTPVVSGAIAGSGPLPGTASQLNAALDMNLMVSYHGGCAVTAQGFIEASDPASRTKLQIVAFSRRFPGWTEKSLATRVYGSGAFSVTYGTPFNSDCVRFELWGKTEYGTANYSAQQVGLLLAA